MLFSGRTKRDKSSWTSGGPESIPTPADGNGGGRIGFPVTENMEDMIQCRDVFFWKTEKTKWVSSYAFGCHGQTRPDHHQKITGDRLLGCIIPADGRDTFESATRVLFLLPTLWARAHARNTSSRYFLADPG